MRRQLTEQDNVFANDTSYKEFTYKIYKELIKINNEKHKQFN